jgi:glycosyltransferase involved in cell wall biosynthesis
MIVLIPAYEPDERLVTLVRSLRERSPESAVSVVVVDDGSGPEYAQVFAAASMPGVDVLGHPKNLGKGAALRTGFAHVTDHYPDQSVVCADCDGQHTPDDIERIASVVAAHKGAVVLGVRSFQGSVPLKSRFGNAITRWFLAMATGSRMQDTQTGLRGYSADLLPWASSVSGDRFEYELNLLLGATSRGLEVIEVPTETIYIDGNSSTHFRPIVDSARVYAPLIKFGFSSIASFLIDFVGLFIMMALTHNLLASVVTARVTSATVNFATNRRHVFGAVGRTSLVGSMLRYATLVFVILVCNYGLIRVLTKDLHVPLLIAKLATELTLFTLSYQIQRRYIFGDRAKSHEDQLQPSIEPGR